MGATSNSESTTTDRILQCSVLVFALVFITFVLYSFAIILKRKRELVALLIFAFGFLVTVNVLWLFLAVPGVSMQYVIVFCPDDTHLL